MAKRSSGKNARPAIDANAAKEAVGTEKPTLNLRLIRQAIDALWMPQGLGKEEALARAKSAIELLQGIKPADEIEGMLATQMVATHSAAMECLRRAMIPNQTFDGFEHTLKHAAKLMAIYARQMDALNKHRGKGQQKVTVEHVHVAAGGQAMVGHIETAPKPPISSNQSKDAQKTIAHAPAEPFEMKSEKRLPAKQRKK